jgi:ribosomal protein S18 acetylase RimI-like enzyme
VLAGLPARTDLPPVTFADAPSEEWLAAYHYRGGALPPVAADVLRLGAAPAFGSVVEDGAVVAIVRSALDEGWVGLTAVEVDPAHRRRGLGTHLLRGVLEHGLDRGARCVYLQVDDTNTAAQALYDGVGFSTHHTYRYLRATAPTGGQP